MKLDNLRKIASDIKELKIQGAQNVALEAVKAFMPFVKNKKEAEEAYNLLISARPTEPALRNALNYALKNKDKTHLEDDIIKILKNGKKKIAEIGARKIKDDMNIVTYCHSSTVTAVLIKAYDAGRKFKVFVCETRPLYQGRKTAKELAEYGIDVEFIVDSNMSFPLSKADLVLIGADSISVEGNVINKVGSKLLSIIAEKYDVPLYVCTHSWKINTKTEHGYDEEIESRDPKEVWDYEHENIKIHNHAFEIVDNEDVTGIITELGVSAPEQVLSKVKKEYPILI